MEGWREGGRGRKKRSRKKKGFNGDKVKWRKQVIKSYSYNMKVKLHNSSSSNQESQFHLASVFPSRSPLLVLWLGEVSWEAPS